MKSLILLSLIWSSMTYANSCEKNLRELNRKASSPRKLDSHVSFQVTAAANRISNSSFWKMEPQVLKIQDHFNKSFFKHPGLNLTLFYNDHAEVSGYIKQVKDKKSFWCMKDK